MADPAVADPLFAEWNRLEARDCLGHSDHAVAWSYRGPAEEVDHDVVQVAAFLDQRFDHQTLTAADCDQN